VFGTSDANGRFAITDVPVGPIVLVGARHDDRWSTQIARTIPSTARDSFDLGEIEVAPPGMKPTD